MKEVLGMFPLPIKVEVHCFSSPSFVGGWKGEDGKCSNKTNWYGFELLPWSTKFGSIWILPVNIVIVKKKKTLKLSQSTLSVLNQDARASQKKETLLRENLKTTITTYYQKSPTSVFTNVPCTPWV